MSDRRGFPGRILVFLCLIVIVSIPSARADVQDIYTIDRIQVDERAADELTAKAEGIAKAQADALQRLLEKITLRDDFDKLPEIDAAAVQRTLRDYAVIEEKFGGGRYVATLSVRFRRQEVREMLRRRDVPIAETASQPVVVLPVYRVAGSVLLWDDPNPWFNAWAERPSTNGLLPLIVPLGDYSDVAAISAEQAMNGDEERLAAVARKYKAIGTLVTIAELEVDPRSGVPSVQVSMTRFGRADTGRTFVRSFSASSSEGVEALLREAVRVLIIRAEEDWKRDNLQRPSGGVQRLSLYVPLTSLKDWIAIRERLARISPIIEMKLDRISVKEAKLTLKVSGSPDQLRLAMAQSDLEMEFADGRGGYVLRLGRNP